MTLGTNKSAVPVGMWPKARVKETRRFSFLRTVPLNFPFLHHLYSSNHTGKVPTFRNLARTISSKWKGLQPGVQESYGKLAAIQRRQYEVECDKASTKVWKNHKKLSPVTVPLPGLVEDHEVDQVVDDVLSELQMDETVVKETNPKQTDFWPLLGCSTPIANFVRNQCFPQHVLKHKTTCLPCTVIVSNPNIKTLEQSLDRDGRGFCLQALLCEDCALQNSVSVKH
jgi:hypothetical protein